MTAYPHRGWFYLLFTLSGFAALIYESIWSHYLKLFLGHAAYAQTLVLAIFMGGMALGSWLCSRYGARWRNLLLGYAVTEAVIGLCALLFHRVFVGATEFAYDSVMPGLGSPILVTAFKWAVSALLILPQSVLLGMTFPLMSAGLIRAQPERSGSTIAMLYFTNSLGAAAGVLASGFVLVALIGLPGTMMTAGLINILLALVIWLLAKDMAFTAAPVPPDRRGSGPSAGPGYSLMLAVAALTGTASFIYEIGWIRMLSMVLGSSTHAFELMLSAFILGLAFGGLWIKRRIDAIVRPEVFLGIVQVVMGVLALGTLLVYGYTFELMQGLLRILDRNETSYSVFNAGSHLIALIVMFPAAFCAGMTLPLITHALLRRGAGERAIGTVYAANTLGAIAGVFLAVHLGMPLLGLKGLIMAGSAIDIALGLVLLWRAAGGTRTPAYATVVGGAAVLATAAWVDLEPHKMASGVYRHGGLPSRDKIEVVYARDGKTATVNLVKTPGRLSIHTNGKSDAAISTDPEALPRPDEATMILTGALPLALHPQARTAANIGLGSGLTSHVMLASESIREVDTIEIESAMVEGARGFGPRNENVYRDPRSRIYIEDAKTFFSTHNKRYDIIASEPSNPWVSGVSGLFTEEFYRHIKRHLSEGGLFVQWMQIYEINPPLVASVFKALSRHFTDYAVFAPTDSDIIIVARDRPLPPLSDAIFRQARVARELERISIRTVGDLELHRIGNRRGMQPYFDGFAIAPNSDFFPVLDLNAAKARFLNANASEIVNLALAAVPILEMLRAAPPRAEISSGPRPWLKRAEHARQGLAVRDYLLTGDARHIGRIASVLHGDIKLVRLLMIECVPPRAAVSPEQFLAVTGAMVPYLSASELQSLWRKLQGSSCAPRFAEWQKSWIELFAAVNERDAARMTRLAEAMLRHPDFAQMPRRDYLLAAAIVGWLARAERERALQLWNEFGGTLPGDSRSMMPELLRGHLSSPSAGQESPAAEHPPK
jgi:spermidine synthase